MAKMFDDFFFVSGVEKSQVANPPKRILPKFRADRSHVRGVNGRSKFDVASAGFAKRKQLLRAEVNGLSVYLYPEVSRQVP